MTAYRCPAHPGEHVTWKGTGCRRCHADDAQRVNRRARRSARLTAQSNRYATEPEWSPIP